MCVCVCVLRLNFIVMHTNTDMGMYTQAHTCARCTHSNNTIAKMLTDYV